MRQTLSKSVSFVACSCCTCVKKDMTLGRDTKTSEVTTGSNEICCIRGTLTVLEQFSAAGTEVRDYSEPI